MPDEETMQAHRCRFLKPFMNKIFSQDFTPFLCFLAEVHTYVYQYPVFWIFFSNFS